MAGQAGLTEHTALHCVLRPSLSGTLSIEKAEEHEIDLLWGHVFTMISTARNE